jgi:hypothetical protein
VPRSVRLALAAAALSLTLAACSGDADDAPAPPSPTAPSTTPPSTTPPSTTAAPATSATSLLPSSTTPPSTGATTAPTTQTRRLARFQTPTGNIACDAREGSIRCDILEKSWTPPPKPADCDLDWGSALALDSDGAPVIVCVGDTVADPTLPRLAYGTASAAEGITCVSREDGLTCTSDRTRRGFFLSRARYQLL